MDKEKSSLAAAWAGYRDKVFALDTRSLALFRIALGLVVLLSLGLRLGDFQAHYTDAGVLPVPDLGDAWGARLYWSLYALNASSWWAALLFALSAVCAAGFAAGIAWRWCGIVLWVLLVSLSNRNHLILNSGDLLLLFLLLWGLFLPLGRHWRVPWLGGGETRAEPALATGVPAVAMVLQFVFLYFFTAMYKTHPQWHGEMSAVWYTLQLPSFTHPLGAFLGEFPLLCQVMTITVWWAELIVPLLLFLPYRNHWWRFVAVAFSLALHGGFLLTLSLGMFPWVSICLALPLLPPRFWEFFSALGWRFIPPASGPVQWLLPPRWSAILCAVLLVFVFFSNCEHLPGVASGKLSIIRDRMVEEDPSAPAALVLAVAAETARQAGDIFRLHQNWGMFAPRPLQRDGWVVIEARLNDGSVVDLMPALRRLDTTHEPVLDWPDAPLAGYHTPRWRKYFTNIFRTRRETGLPNLTRYVVEGWDANHDPARHIAALRIRYFTRLNLWGQTPEPIEETVVHEWARDGDVQWN